MKILLPVAAVLLLGAIALLRKDEAGATRPCALRRQDPRVVEATPSKEQGHETLRAARGESLELSTPSVSATKASPETVFNASTQEMEFALKDELNLTELQQLRVHQALESRQIELQECHDGIRKSKVFDPRAYGKKLIRMKEDWFRNIDGVLDSRQHQLFQELVADGILRAGTEFLANLDVMTVIR